MLHSPVFGVLAFIFIVGGISIAIISIVRGNKMPKWAVILTVTFTGLIMVVTVASFIINIATNDDIQRLEKRFENIATKDDIHRLEKRFDNLEKRFENVANKDDIQQLLEYANKGFNMTEDKLDKVMGKIENVNNRIDKHLENHQ